jgi:hypothetical protein
MQEQQQSRAAKDIASQGQQKRNHEACTLTFEDERFPALLPMYLIKDAFAFPAKPPQCESLPSSECNAKPVEKKNAKASYKKRVST